MSTQAAFLGSKAARNLKLSPEAGAGNGAGWKRGGSEYPHGVAYNHPISKDYKWYISGIYCQLGDYKSPTTY